LVAEDETSIHFQLIIEEQYVNNIQRLIDFVGLALYDKRINVERIGQSTENKKDSESSCSAWSEYTQ